MRVHRFGEERNPIRQALGLLKVRLGRQGQSDWQPSSEALGLTSRSSS
jgi:hypothetical protein